VGSTIVALTVFALPAGYVDNYIRFGDPFTPTEALAKYSFAHEPWGHALSEGSKNVLRLGLEFLSLDGLPPVEPVNRLQRIVRLPAFALRPLELEEGGIVGRPGFAAYRDPRAREEHAYWGVLGIGLLWIVPWVALRGTRHGAGVRVLAVAAIVYFLSVAYSGEYGPWHGRMFLAMGMFAVPVIACFLEERQSREGGAFTLVVVAAGCVSAISAVVFREHGTLVAASYGPRSVSSILLQDRAGQMTSDIPKYAEAVRRYEAIVLRRDGRDLWRLHVRVRLLRAHDAPDRSPGRRTAADGAIPMAQFSSSSSKTLPDRGGRAARAGLVPASAASQCVTNLGEDAAMCPEPEFELNPEVAHREIEGQLLRSRRTTTCSTR
jgi:hypothetical protein